MTDGPAPMAVDPSAVDYDYRQKKKTYVLALRNYQERSMTRMREASAVHPLDEPRSALEVELGAFLLVMQKSSLVVQAEIMQAQEYELTKERINQEYGETQEEIERLRGELRDAELFRERKKEYDVIAAKINNLPPRSELNQPNKKRLGKSRCQAKHDGGHSTTHSGDDPYTGRIPKQRLKRLLIRPARPRLSCPPRVTTTRHKKAMGRAMKRKNSEDVNTYGAIQPQSRSPPFLPLRHNHKFPLAKPPTSSDVAHRILNPNNANHGSSSIPSSPQSPVGTLDRDLSMQSPELEGPEDGEDIEMGEVAEDDSGMGGLAPSGSGSGSPSRGRGAKRKTAKEDLEEGEASDASSELSSVPD
ncbi:hypothetical protein BS47DRAFT_1362700 [Hydnum rufescens UP504]|uniref:Uncharacterized protein n=1 Tax=Hydnum rufescens UP504 TaxID=1448309 RepID=A0A9P6DTA7_9AGAM|nr:hypothetical protein BS47DRAFT_1362700 [Hydnum rufescens UP504]